MNIPQASNKDFVKQLEYVKQQQQLREFGSLKNNSQSKVLSADSMIEDLLSKKETFQKRNPESLQKQEAAVPSWLSRAPPPVYERVWQGVQTAGGLADTPLLSSVLLTSGLATDTLGYIWSLANRTVPGALTQTEVYLVLALVGLAQVGYVVNNLSALHQVPQAPVPTLDLTLLPTCQPQVYPNTLNVTNLPDPLSFNWASSEVVNPSYSGKIGVSYVSSGPMISPNLISDQTSKSSINMNIADSSVGDNLSDHNYSVSNNSKTNLVLDSKPHADVKRSDNTHCFSFPKLNDSPSHVLNVSPENTDSLDDEFTDFQSADFNSISAPQKIQSNLNSTTDEDEFTNFQKASPNDNSDDLSVLVVGGKSIPSAQQLWVAANPSIHHQKDKLSKIEDKNSGLNFLGEDKLASEKQPGIDEGKGSIEMKYNAFQEIDDDKYSIFHNPLPDEEDKQNIVSCIAVDNMHMETKSIFQHSLLEDPEPPLDILKSVHKTLNLHPDQLSNAMKDNEEDDDDDDEYSNFQNCPVTFPESGSVVSSGNVDKYDVFRTIVFEDTSSQPNALQSKDANGTQHLSQTHSAESDTSLSKKENKCMYLFNDSSETRSVDSIKFSDIQEPSGDNTNIDNLFSSLVVSDRNHELETNSVLGPVRDKYKALRLLEPSSDEIDEFGDFLGAELPNSGNDPRNSKDLSLVQIRCLEACLNLLKDGVSKMSQGSTPEIISEVLSDARANAYLDCLLEVHRVSQRIISQLNSDSCVSVIAELHETWDCLAPYFKHAEHIHLVETVGDMCGVCRSNTGPSPVTFGAQTFHTPCANLYLHCVEPVLPNIAAALVQ